MPHADDVLALAPPAFRPGSLRGAEGFFRVGQDSAGRWWLLNPEDGFFFLKAVHGVRGAARPHDLLPEMRHAE